VVHRVRDAVEFQVGLEEQMSTTTESALDAALAVIDAQPIADDSQALVAAKCKGLMRGYDARWRDAGYVTEAVEQVLTAPLVNPETQAKSRTFKLAGKLDVIATYNGRRVLFDHKTTTQDITDPNSPYWRQLVVEGQPSHYGILGWANGIKFDQTVWDVIRKPGIKPAKLTKAERGSVLATHRYYGVTVADDTMQGLAGTEERESLAMYESRLAYDCTVERPEWYFARRPVPRMDHELLEYSQKAWEIGQDILATRNSGRVYGNAGACMLYNRPCVFLGVCSGHDTLESDRWKRKEFVHNELPSDGGDGRDLLTNSRIKTYQTCRRMHHNQYELGIERHDEDEAEALWFGTLFHSALEAWFRCFMVSSEE
jgi:hypothetical protein